MPNPNPKQSKAFLNQIGKNGGKKPKKPDKIPKLYRVNLSTAEFIAEYAKTHKLSQGDALDKIVQMFKKTIDIIPN